MVRSCSYSLYCGPHLTTLNGSPASTDHLTTLSARRRENGTVKFLTKGDNNSVDDRGLYAPGQLWLTKKDVVGRARGFVPYIGIVTILMNDYPKLKVGHTLLY